MMHTPSKHNSPAPQPNHLILYSRWFHHFILRKHPISLKQKLVKLLLWQFYQSVYLRHGFYLNFDVFVVGLDSIKRKLSQCKCEGVHHFGGDGYGALADSSGLAVAFTTVSFVLAFSFFFDSAETIFFLIVC